MALFFAATSFANTESLSQPELQDLNTALSALQQGRHDQALELLRPLYGNYPQHAEITNNFAVALFNTGQTTEAGIVLQSYLQSHSEVGVASNNLFSVYDYLAAESYSMLSGGDPEKPILTLASSKPDHVEPAEPEVLLRASSEDISSQAAAIEQRLQGYLAAWSNGNAEDYLSYYYPERSPVRGQGFQRWKEERLSKIFPERNISVSINDLQIMPIDDSQAIAVYRQEYSARNYNDETTKQLTWLKQGDEWYIRYEQALPN